MNLVGILEQTNFRFLKYVDSSTSQKIISSSLSLPAVLFSLQLLCSRVAITASPFNILKCSACPGRPTSVVATFPTEQCGNSARVTWAAPTTGGPIAEYILSCVSSAGTTTATVGGQVLTTTVGPLVTSGVQYTCSVTARNSAGDSGPASATAFTTGYALVFFDCF